MADPRKVAVIGAGIGAKHIAGFAALPDRFEIAAVCDLDEERARAGLAEGQSAKITGDYNEILADPEIDIIDICLPPHLHCQTALQALDAGKHVICEKPLVSSLQDVDRLAAKSKETGKSVFPVFQYRYGTGGSQLRALREAGLTGKPFIATLETHWNRSTAYYSVDWRGTWAGEQGGAVLGHAIHIHDWLSFAFGPVASVYAELDTRVNDIEVEDCAALSIRMESGALVTSSITLGAANDTSRLRFCYEGLTAESGRNPYRPADDTWTFIARDPFKQKSIDDTLAKVSGDPSAYAGFFEAIDEALNGNPGREVTLNDGRRSVEFVTAVYASARSDRRVDLPLDEKHGLYTGWMP